MSTGDSSARKKEIKMDKKETKTSKKSLFLCILLTFTVVIGAIFIWNFILQKTDSERIARENALKNSKTYIQEALDLTDRSKGEPKDLFFYRDMIHYQLRQGACERTKHLWSEQYASTPLSCDVVEDTRNTPLYMNYLIQSTVNQLEQINYEKKPNGEQYVWYRATLSIDAWRLKKMDSSSDGSLANQTAQITFPEILVITDKEGKILKTDLPVVAKQFSFLWTGGDDMLEVPWNK